MKTPLSGERLEVVGATFYSRPISICVPLMPILPGSKLPYHLRCLSVNSFAIRGHTSTLTADRLTLHLPPLGADWPPPHYCLSFEKKPRSYKYGTTCHVTGSAEAAHQNFLRDIMSTRNIVLSDDTINGVQDTGRRSDRIEAVCTSQSRSISHAHSSIRKCCFCGGMVMDTHYQCQMRSDMRTCLGLSHSSQANAIRPPYGCTVNSVINVKGFLAGWPVINSEYTVEQIKDINNRRFGPAFDKPIVQMQSQANRQEPFSFNGAFSPSVFLPRVPADSVALDFTESAIQSSNQHGSIPVASGPGIERPNGGDMIGLIPGYDLNHMARTWEVPVPQRNGGNNHSGYTPSVQNEYFGQGETNYAGEYAAPNNQGTFPVWRLLSGWVSYATQDEVHVTIALKRIPNPSPDHSRR